MRKQVVRVPQITAAWDQGWLDLNKAASVEVSSEDQNYPIESALLGDEKTGWRAAKPGTQTIRLIFDSRKTSDAFSWPLKTAKPSARRSLF